MIQQTQIVLSYSRGNTAIGHGMNTEH